jgi:hypothetical protein
MTKTMRLLVGSAGVIGLVAMGVGSIPIANASCGGEACAQISINASAKEIINKDKTKDIHIVGCLKFKEKIMKVITCHLESKVDVVLKKGTDYSWAPLEAIVRGKFQVDGDVQMDVTSALFAR